MAAYYRGSVDEFLRASRSEVIGQLTRGNARFGFAEVEREQIEAWEEELAQLRKQLADLCHNAPGALRWGLLLEFPIPRRQQRIDAVLLVGGLIFVLEFKSRIAGSTWSAGRQAEDYALDLAYFHAPSHDKIIMPVVIAPGLQHNASRNVGGNVRSCGTTSPEQLSSFLLAALRSERRDEQEEINVQHWDEGRYEPVPTVIEAAMALYAGMSVREIARSHAGQENLTAVTDFLLDAITRAQTEREKIICFITGIPGAGKTLAGLNLVHNPEIHGSGRPASVFMSGNGPLVDILREALAIDCAHRTGTTRTRARLQVRTFVQNIHHFVKDNLERPDTQPAYEHAIVFDEAQRAWNSEKNRKKYQKQSPVWHVSEPEMVLKIMDRHKDWATVVALVGGGQEIHDGEAGLGEWGKALSKYSHWKVLVSPEALKGGESVGGTSLFVGETVTNTVHEERTLHLDVCVRSHQATEFATWVNCVLRGDTATAAKLSAKIRPISGWIVSRRQSSEGVVNGTRARPAALWPDSELRGSTLAGLRF